MKKPLMNRRTFLECSLGGAATLMGLPLLEEMLSTVAQAAGPGYPDANFVALFKPMGCDRRSFFPEQYGGPNPTTGRFIGNQWSMSRTLSPLQAYKDYINVYAGLGYGVQGYDHNEEALRFLTGLGPVDQDWKAPAVLDTGNIPGQTGKSLDQYIADHLYSTGNPGRGSRHSLQLASDFHSENYRVRNVISFENKDKALFGEYDVQRLFDSLFFGFNPAAANSAAKDRQVRKKNILDEIWNSRTKSLINGLSASSKQTVQQYLASIESVKSKIDTSGGGMGTSCGKPERPPKIPGTGSPRIEDSMYQLHVEIMMDLMVIALQCNMTRVISYMFGPGQGSHRSWGNILDVSKYPYPDVMKYALTHEWHTWSHASTLGHPTAPYDVWYPAYQACNAALDEWHVQRVAYFVKKLKDANLLDRTFVLFGGGLGDPEDHRPYAPPCVTIGRGAGAKTNQLHVLRKYEDHDSPGSSIARLHVDIMNAFGVQGPTMSNFGIRAGEDPNRTGRSVMLDVFG